MTREERAKQFLPFDALKGLQEALDEQERLATRVARRRLTEEAASRLSRALLRVQAGDRVLIEFYYGGHYLLIEAEIAAKNEAEAFLMIGQTPIRYEDIVRLKILTT